jgi:hypothetical protein
MPTTRPTSTGLGPNCQIAVLDGSVLIRKQDFHERVLFIFGRRPTVIAPGFVSIAVTADKGQRTADELLELFIIKFAEQYFTAFTTARTMECLTFFYAH